MTSVYTEKDILGDALTMSKTSTNNYNTYSNECVHENVRSTMLKLLSEEHEIQNDIFKMMHDKGYYPTPDAEQKKVQEAKDRHAQCFGQC